MFSCRDKTTFKNFFQVRFSTGLTDRRRRTSAWRLANRGGREKLLSRKISLGTVFYKSYGITFLSRAGERWYQLNGKSFAFSEASSRAASNRGKRRKLFQPGCRCRFKIENPRHPSITFRKMFFPVERDKQTFPRTLTCSSADKYWRIDELLLYRLGLSFKILFHCSTFVIPTLVKKDERQIKTDSNSSSTNITESLSCKL